MAWWRHRMETFPRYWPFVRGIHRSPVNSTHKGQWRGALMFSFIRAWLNGNNGEAGDLRRHRAHYCIYVTVMGEATSGGYCRGPVPGSLLWPLGNRDPSVEWTPISFSHGCLVSGQAATTRKSWWRHQMETFSALLALCEGNSPVTGEFSSQRPLTRNFDVFFDLRLNKWLNKSSRRRWFEMPSRSLWRHCNGMRRRWFAVSVSTQALTWPIVP